MKKITLTLLTAVIFLFSASSIKAQKSQGGLTLTGGVGYSLGMSILQTGINSGLSASGLAKLKSTPIINAMVDYGVSDGFSLGGAYTFNKISWNDEYSETFHDSITGLDSIVTTQGGVYAQRQNIALRGLFHFGDDETIDMYAGARLGYSLWKVGYDASTTSGQSASDFNAPAGIFSVQALFGVRKYFNDVIGVNFEVGLGTAPYFVAGGLSFRLQ